MISQAAQNNKTKIPKAEVDTISMEKILTDGQRGALVRISGPLKTNMQHGLQTVYLIGARKSSAYNNSTEEHETLISRFNEISSQTDSTKMKGQKNEEMHHCFA